MGKFNFGSFSGGLVSGYSAGQKIADSMKEDRLRDDIQRAMQISPEQSTAYTPEQGRQLEAVAAAKDETGKPYYQLGYDQEKRAYTVGLNPDRQSAGLESVQPKSTEPPPADLTSQQQAADSVGGRVFHENVGQAAGGTDGAGLVSIEPKATFNLGGKTQEQPFTRGQIQQERLQRAADIYVMAGKPERAAQIEALAEHRRKAAENEETRAMLAKVGDGGIEHLTRETPRIISHYLKQGDVAKAKAFQDFADSAEGRDYARNFAQAQHLVTVGDFDGAIPTLQKLYGRFPDGNRAEFQHLGDGKYQVNLVDEQSGEVRGSRTMTAADLSKQALNYLSPVKLVEFTANQNAKRDSEAAILERQTQLEQLRQQGQEARDDRRDDRLTMRLEAAANRANAGPKLTLSQQAHNYEIDSARKILDGMSPEEIRRRTAPTTATGRENPDFYPSLARNARIAARRKVGEDDVFDARMDGGGADSVPRAAPSGTQSFTKAEVAAALKAGADRGKVAERIKSLGGNPADYGL